METAELTAAETPVPKQTAAAVATAAIDPRPCAGGLCGRRWWMGVGLVLTIALAALVPTTGDFGLTWDEPAYRYSQLLSAQWWEQLSRVRSWGDLRAVLDPDTLLYHWPYGRFGINFHPPLAGQLDLAAYAAFGSWMKDIPARRMASVIEFALTIAILFGFLSRRYGTGVGLVAAGSLLLMPRLYGQAHLVDTDIPGLLLWAATAVAFWNGLHEERARPWRVLVGVLLGLAFVEKMAAVGVLLPLLLWLIAGHLPRSLKRPGARANWIDGLLTSGIMLLPLGLAFLEIQSLQRQFPLPRQTDLFVHRPASDLPGAILAVPIAVWLLRRLLGRIFSRSPIWGVERPALETWTAILAFAPLVGWLGNPAWWRDTLPRLTHYYALSTNRRGALPDIQIIYFGQIYEFSLPWHNGWVLLGITVPVTLLLAAAVGLMASLRRVRSDRVPVYFLVHFLTLPVLRMLDTPAHDGVRLFLPTFFFLSAFAGWGTMAAARLLARVVRVPTTIAAVATASLVLIPAAVDLVHIHPYELSYYNSLIGGPRGAWHRGFELTYWFDSFNDQTLEEINRKLPTDAMLQMPNVLTNPPTFQELQTLGALRGDIRLGELPWEQPSERFPFIAMQTQDSKASAFSRLLFAMRPWYSREPGQVDGLRLATVADPIAVSRAWALQCLLDAADRTPPDPPAAPSWIRAIDRFLVPPAKDARDSRTGTAPSRKDYTPILGRFWGDGLRKIHRLTLNQDVLDWARSDPQGLLEAARHLAEHKAPQASPAAERLLRVASRASLERLLKARPQGLVEGVQILVDHTADVVNVMTRYGYTDPLTIGGFLDRDLPDPPDVIAAKRPEH